MLIYFYRYIRDDCVKEVKCPPVSDVRRFSNWGPSVSST